ncbi:hypothetical protein V6N11_020717 [Hibiscus sabdariffa]|uniref:Uncharacterized protein n=1 Tax=Hibiscus sabdariffa TaxID=183260 RepID=A0ABR2Q982_9ROSI
MEKERKYSFGATLQEELDQHYIAEAKHIRCLDSWKHVQSLVEPVKNVGATKNNVLLFRLCRLHSETTFHCQDVFVGFGYGKVDASGCSLWTYDPLIRHRELGVVWFEARGQVHESFAVEPLPVGRYITVERYCVSYVGSNQR